jgi:hypothetical protein
MGVMATQVGHDQIGRDLLCLCRRTARFDEQSGDFGFEFLRRDKVVHGVNLKERLEGSSRAQVDTL